jgi:hypothetical protein
MYSENTLDVCLHMQTDESIVPVAKLLTCLCILIYFVRFTFLFTLVISCDFSLFLFIFDTRVIDCRPTAAVLRIQAFNVDSVLKVSGEL